MSGIKAFKTASSILNGHNLILVVRYRSMSRILFSFEVESSSDRKNSLVFHSWDLSYDEAQTHNPAGGALASDVAKKGEQGLWKVRNKILFS